MARRLVEHGIPYVAIDYKGWDTHKQHFETMNRKLPEMDQGMSALLQDLRIAACSTARSCGGAANSAVHPKYSGKRPGTGGAARLASVFPPSWPEEASREAGWWEHQMRAGERGGRAPRPPARSDRDALSPARHQPESPLPNPEGQDIRVMPRGGEGNGLLQEII